MNVIRTVGEMRAAVGTARSDRANIAFVPTMGALHEGHLSLVDAARQRASLVVMSVFVNPLQFGPGEDFDAYPRDESRDADLARDRGVELLFAPGLDEIHPPGRTTTVSVRGMVTSVLEGAIRPGHFDGVTTVLSSLFHIVEPHTAFFGQKDAQQLAVVCKMVHDLRFRLEVVACPTIRDADGLALSSRNAYLSDDERVSALSLNKALKEGAAVLRETDDVARAEEAMTRVLDVPGVVLEYAKGVDPDTFESPARKPVLLVVAARVGRARLLDNMLVS